MKKVFIRDLELILRVNEMCFALKYCSCCALCVAFLSIMDINIHVQELNITIN